MNYLELSINQAIDEQEIPTFWSEAINSELKKINPIYSSSRINLVKKPFVTIDGKDAKDFDDAILCEQKTNGFTLWVAIADVAEVVIENSALDKEALKRGTSIYFPNYVIPMLPEKISNDICSLVPNKKRNVLVCKIEFNLKAEIESFEFLEAIISSHKRFSIIYRKFILKRF